MNKKLAELYIDRLLPRFGNHARRSGDPQGLLDPWWWPMRAGTTAEDWGLDAADAASRKALVSLRGGSGAEATKPPYEHFAGSLGCKASRCERWVLSSRPSCGRFPSGTTGKLVGILGRLDWIGSTHVCDMFKFRGHGPDARADQDASADLWALSLDILSEEFAITAPKVVVVAGTKTQNWIDLALQTHRNGRHGPFLGELCSRIARVPSWMAHTTSESIESAWRDAHGAGNPECPVIFDRPSVKRKAFAAPKER